MPPAQLRLRDGWSLVSAEATEPAGALDRDFVALAAARRLMLRSEPRRLADHGRAATDAWIRRFAAPVDASVAVSAIDGPSARDEIVPAGGATRTLIYLHGGGLVYHDRTLFRPLLTRLAAAARLTVLSLDYPKAPETPPLDILASVSASLNAALARATDHEVLIAGDSVGGLMALHFALGPWVGRFVGIHLLYPVVAATRHYDDRLGRAGFLDSAMMGWFRTFIDPIFAAGGGAPLDRPAGRIRRLPPVVIHAAEQDILCPEALAFAKRCREAGVLKRLILHRGLPHDFCLYGSRPAAAAAVDRIAAELRDAPAPCAAGAAPAAGR